MSNTKAARILNNSHEQALAHIDAVRRSLDDAAKAAYLESGEPGFEVWAALQRVNRVHNACVDIVRRGRKRR